MHHVAFICRDVEETIRFYQEFLGFPLVELVENRDYAGSSHFFFDIGHDNLLGFFDFPGHEHPEYHETIGGLQHLALSVTAEQFAGPGDGWTRPGRTTSGPTGAWRTASTSAIPTGSAWSCTGSGSGIRRQAAALSGPGGWGARAPRGGAEVTPPATAGGRRSWCARCARA